MSTAVELERVHVEEQIMPKKLKLKTTPFIDGLKATEVQDIPLEDIDEVKTFQYRLSANVGDLKHSLLSDGQREPIDLTGSKPYRIIDGFRRVEAISAIGWPVVKAFVHKGITDEEAHRVAFIKNVVRKNLSPMDKANAIFQAKQRNMKSSELTGYFGLSEKQLKRYEALLNFPAEIQKLLEKDSISMGHAKALADFKVKDKDLPNWLSMINDGFSAKQLKKELKKSSGAKSGGKTKLYMKREKGVVRMYPFTIAKDSPKDEREKVVKLLLEAVEVLRG